MKYHRWTKSDSKYIIQTIRHNPDNLSAAFRICAIHFNVTPTAVELHYRRHIKGKHYLFTLISPYRVVKNKKITKTNVSNLLATIFKR